MLDEIICINKDEIPDSRARVLSCKRFVHYLVTMVVLRSFCVGAYKYERHGSLYDWIVVLKAALGAIYKSQSFIEAIASAAHQAPIFLSRRETYDYVASV